MTARPCVVVPIYYFPLNSSDSDSLLNLISILHQYPIILLLPKRLHDTFICSQFAQSLRTTSLKFYSVDDSWLESLTSYNRMCMSHSFYSLFVDHSHILIAQLDSFVFSDQLMYWCNQGFSFIGAPWLSKSCSSDVLEFVGVGNGGFSLRYVPHFCYVSSLKSRKRLLIPISTLRLALQHLSLSSQLKFILQYFFALIFNSKHYYPLTEDLFWSYCAPLLLVDYKIPPPTVALRFSFEMFPTLLYKYNLSQLPFGCHAWKKYEPLFWYYIAGLK